MKRIKNTLLKIFIVTLIISISSIKVMADPCSNCNDALIIQSHVMTENYRYTVGMLTPFVGGASDTYLGGSWNNDLSKFINFMGAVVSAWELWRNSLLQWQTSFSLLALNNSLIGAAGQYWEQLHAAEINFHYEMAVLDRDYCNCLIGRGCATSCNFLN